MKQLSDIHYYAMKRFQSQLGKSFKIPNTAVSTVK